MYNKQTPQSLTVFSVISNSHQVYCKSTTAPFFRNRWMLSFMEHDLTTFILLIKTETIIADVTVLLSYRVQIEVLVQYLVSIYQVLSKTPILFQTQRIPFGILLIISIIQILMKIFIAFSPLKTRSSRKSYQLQCRVCTFLKSSLKTLCYDRHDPKDSILVIQYIIKNRKSHSNNARSVPQISKEVCNMFALFCSIQLGFISI